MAAGVSGGVLLGVLSAYTIILLTRVEKYLVAHSDDPTRRMTYPQVAHKVFHRIIWGIRVHDAIVYANIVATVIGACMAYVIFIAQTLPQVITALHDV